MPQAVRTKLHILAEYAARINGRIVNASEMPVVRKMLNAANYVIDYEVWELMRRHDVSKSVRALVEAGIARLPMSPMVIEYQPSETHHVFVLLEDGHTVTTRDGQKCEGMILHVAFMPKSAEWIQVGDTPLPYAFMDGRIVAPYVPPIPVGLTSTVYVEALEAQSFTETALLCGLAAIDLALLMLNTKGIEKEVIEVAPLNKHRVSKGRVPIPRHSVVHIGSIYRRDETAITRGQGRGAGGWKMPMHWRQGYTRRQRYGKGREQEKIVFIQPCIVNYLPEGETPVIKKVIRL